MEMELQKMQYRMTKVRKESLEEKRPDGWSSEKNKFMHLGI